jgi:hypothetical protein
MTSSRNGRELLERPKMMDSEPDCWPDSTRKTKQTKSLGGERSGRR